MLLRWLRALIAWLFRKAPPSPVTKVKVKVKQMNTIHVVWKDPTTRTDGSSVELSHVDVSLRVAGAPDFTLFASVAPGVQEARVTDLPPGSYEVQIVPFDTQTPQRAGQAVVGTAVIPSPPLAEPSPVTDVIITVE